jgi:hypothetical protein
VELSFGMPPPFHPFHPFSQRHLCGNWACVHDASLSLDPS